MNPTAEHFLALRRSSVLAGVPDASIESLLSAGSLERCSAGYRLFAAGDPGDEVFFILDGSFEIGLRSASGASQARRVQGAGELLGEIALFTHGRRSADATCRDAAVFLRIGRDIFLELLASWPQIALALLRTLSERLIEAEAAARR